MSWSQTADFISTFLTLSNNKGFLSNLLSLFIDDTMDIVGVPRTSFKRTKYLTFVVLRHHDLTKTYKKLFDENLFSLSKLFWSSSRFLQTDVKRLN